MAPPLTNSRTVSINERTDGFGFVIIIVLFFFVDIQTDFFDGNSKLSTSADNDVTVVQSTSSTMTDVDADIEGRPRQTYSRHLATSAPYSATDSSVAMSGSMSGDETRPPSYEDRYTSTTGIGALPSPSSSSPPASASSSTSDAVPDPDVERSTSVWDGTSDASSQLSTDGRREASCSGNSSDVVQRSASSASASSKKESTSGSQVDGDGGAADETGSTVDDDSEDDLEPSAFRFFFIKMLTTLKLGECGCWTEILKYE